MVDVSISVQNRLRTLYTLRALATNEAVDAAKGALNDESALLAHEVAYCLGQTQNPHAIPSLVDALKNESIHPMVRHEAAEALGAIGVSDELVISALKEFAQSPIPEVRDTCIISLDLLEWKQKNQDKADLNAHHPLYMSVDPAPPVEDDEVAKEARVAKLEGKLMNKEATIFERYRALFALRNIGTEEAVEALGRALDDTTEGAVFSHEIAYVLGQIQSKAATESLKRALANKDLNCMIRHEAAEALGNILTSPEDLEFLKEFTNDTDGAVSESCFVALDIYEYNTSTELNYASGL
eukprot:TRINITY_DN15419_c0_g1_i1.p1 TRINITY_DN15419_c0_g1~~TRINITY_DN15419_c0_g1_i1.p1  ORF type:complete len:332 (-),score=108.96 TRINITY_DN15419_c0_g1_i1:123-1013(-)